MRGYGSTGPEPVVKGEQRLAKGICIGDRKIWQRVLFEPQPGEFTSATLPLEPQLSYLWH